MSESTETKLTTSEEAIDFFVRLTEAALTEAPSEAERGTLRAQAAQVVDGFQSLALAFQLWSEAPKSLCPNHLTQTFLVSKSDGSDDGCVEIVLRRVRPGGESFAALMTDAVRAKAIRAAGSEWRATLTSEESASGPETIATAAIRIGNEVWTLPRPARHHVLQRAYWLAWGHDVERRQEAWEGVEGFVTSRGRFVDRAEAEQLARAAGQVTGEILGGELTSEDLW